MLIRAEQPADLAAIHQVNEAAFGQPAEADLVDRLRANGKAVLSLVAEDNGLIVGHILFSDVTVETNPQAIKLIGLAPLAVLPVHQRSGIGSQLVSEGLVACWAAGYSAVIVLGHPEYYPCFGFVPASQYGLTSEYNVPAEVFMAVELKDGALTDCHGLARYQAEFSEL